MYFMVIAFRGDGERDGGGDGEDHGEVVPGVSAGDRPLPGGAAGK
jgi:hypothetical protein